MDFTASTIEHRDTTVLGTPAGSITVDDSGRRVYWALAYDASAIDLHGTTMTAGALAESAAALNYSILLFHDAASFPVGKPVTTAQSDRGVEIGFVFADTEEARTAEALVAGGFLRGVSVGFVPRDGFIRDDGVTVYTDAELVELSLTPTPSSRKALIDLTRSIDSIVGDIIEDDATAVEVCVCGCHRTVEVVEDDEVEELAFEDITDEEARGLDAALLGVEVRDVVAEEQQPSKTSGLDVLGLLRQLRH